MGNTEEAVQLLEDILAIPSVNGQDDEGKVAEYLCDYFRKAGISAQVERIDETHANVSAILEGEDNSKRILWNGHLDTVPYGSLEEWSTDPKVPVTKGDSVYARGASDMKSGLCAMAYALCACKKSGKKIPHSIRFAGTCDEEKGGLGAEAVLKKTQEPYDEIIIGEPTGLKMGIAQKGCIWLELKAHGKTSHGAYPEQGCSAVEHILRIVEKIKQFTEKQEHPVLGHATANITKIEGELRRI